MIMLNNKLYTFYQKTAGFYEHYEHETLTALMWRTSLCKNYGVLLEIPKNDQIFFVFGNAVVIHGYGSLRFETHLPSYEPTLAICGYHKQVIS